MRQTNLAAIIITAAAVGIVALSASASPASPNPFLGTWILNVPKSDFQEGPPMKSETVQITDAGNGLTHYAVQWVDGAGESGHVEYSTAFDGKKESISGSPDYDTVTNKRVDATSYKTVFKKSGKAVEREVHVISKDGKAAYVKDYGKDASGAFTYHLVFDRQ